MKKKHKRSIYQKLVFSYIIFAVVAIIIVIGCFLVDFMLSIGQNMSEEFPGVPLDEAGQVVSADKIIRLGGWVEQLDSDYHVTEVYGDKQTSDMDYTEYQLLTYTNLIQAADLDYYMFWQKAEPYSYLCCYPKTLFSITYSFEAEGIMTTNVSNGALWVMLVLLLLDGLAVSFYIYRKIKKPLDEMIDGMEKVEQGERDITLSVKGEREFITIQNAFHHMVQELEAKRQENEQLIKGRRQMLLELSHDIKTPVATIKSYALALEQGLVTEAESEKYCQTIAKKADRVNVMLDDLFTMLKVENADYNLERKELDAAELTRKICAEFYEEITDAGFEFNIDLPQTAVMIEGDEKLLARVISNLLINAKKYNNTGHKIGISLMQKNGFCIRVTDDGEPIEENIATTMFTPFVRGERARSTNGGTGLGLAIAKSVAVKHGGDLTYTYENHRNTFTLSGIPIV